ncbi:reverse transcriptase [Lasius niger]|uniref:Reverse transcriptase n=1 Tax=Lasius niger TaxID=67767 RepID=A0A0J7MP95_LASNI|nr:reverse transcriptase [Lasius niger]
MRKRDRARRAWRKHRKPELYSVFKLLRNEVQSQIRKAKKNHYWGVLNRRQNAASMWGELRRLGLIGAPKATLGSLDLNELNLAFSSVTHADSDMERGLPGGDESTLDSGQFDDSEFFFLDISPSQLLRAIQKGRSESVGVDGISTRCLKLGLPCLLPYLLHLFNFLLQHSLYPGQ